MKAFLLFLLPITLLAVDDHGHDHDHDHEAHAGEDAHDEHEEGGPLHLDAADRRDFGIVLAQAGPGEIRRELRLPGEIRLNEDAVAHVSLRFSGVATAIRHRLGETVTAGTVLAELESNDTLRPFQLVAPIDGQIVEYHLTLGESMEAGEYAYIIADRSTVWADLRVYQRDLPEIAAGQRVRISAGHHYPTLTGTIAYVAPTVDEVTRTGTARVVVDNPDGLYRPGMFITGQVEHTTETAPVVVPRAALQNIEGNTVLYVETPEGFLAHPVQVGRTDSANAEILDGLEAGETYVAEGSFFLKAESQKAHFGDGHNH